MRDTEKYAQLGEKTIQLHPHYNLETSDYKALSDYAEDDNLLGALERAFFIGVEVGTRIEKKNK